jgi:hydroxypyruvate reductase
VLRYRPACALKSRPPPVIDDPRRILLDLFHAALAAVDPRRTLAPHCPPRPHGRLIVLGAGKGAAAMAQAVEGVYGTALEGLVVVRDGYELPTRAVQVIAAAHPLPDRRSVFAAARLLALARSARPGDLLLGLWSGGASSLMVAPAAGVAFDDKQRVNAALLACGAPIAEINCVRKHLSAVKGGRLAQACGGAAVVSLIVSDVAGDDPAVIASGPTVADPTTCADALAVLRRYGIDPGAAIRRGLEAGLWETPKALPAAVRNLVVARPRDAFVAAAEAAARAGLACLDLGDRCEGDAAALAAEHARLIRAIRAGTHALQPPCLVLSGGEATVRVVGAGCGGPNTEFALHLARALDGLAGVHALACDSDGTDGNGRHAGALIDPTTLTRAAARGLDPARALAANDTAPLFEALGDLIVTGPTFTNVNDFRAVLVL